MEIIFFYNTSYYKKIEFKTFWDPTSAFGLAMQYKRESRTVSIPAFLLVGLLFMSTSSWATSVLSNNDTDCTDQYPNLKLDQDKPSRKLLVAVSQTPSKFSNEQLNWLKSSKGSEGFEFCNQLSKSKCKLNNLNTCDDIVVGCINDYMVTEDKEIAKEGAFFAEDFRSKSKASKSKKYCVASGDPHFVNYDGQYFDLQESGIYTLVKYNNFEVQESMIKHTSGKYRGGIPSCVDGLAIKFNKLIFQFDVNNLKNFVLNGKKLDLVQNKQLQFGGVDVFYGKQKFEWKGDKFTSNALKLTFPNGFSVGLFGSYCGSVEINVPENAFGKTTGICGNSDGSNDRFDYKDRLGQLMDVKFGNKNWEFSGNDGSNSPMSKWQLEWKSVGSGCLFSSKCESIHIKSTVTKPKSDTFNKVVVPAPVTTRPAPVTTRPVIMTTPKPVTTPRPISNAPLTVLKQTPKPVPTSSPIPITNSASTKTTVPLVPLVLHVSQNQSKNLKSESKQTKGSKPDLSQVHNYSNQTAIRLDVLRSKVEQLMSELVKDNEKQMNELGKNLEGSNQTLNVANDNYQKSVISLNKLKSEINSLNKTMLDHYQQMMFDSKYLEKLEMIKPEFLNTLSVTNSKLSNVENLITAHIVQSNDKNQMLQLIQDIRNTTHYSTNDLSKQFLDHYEKYKKLIKTDSSQYASDKINLDQLVNKFNDVNKYSKELYEEYKRIYIIVQKLKDTMNISKEENKLFKQLIQSLTNVLTRKTCIMPEFVKYTGSNNTQCATELLNSHVANNLVR